MEVLSDNKFLFTFYNKSDIDYVMERQPWTLEKHVLFMEKISPLEQPSKVLLDKAVFWIQLIDLPISAMKENIIQKLGSRAGRVIEVGYQKDNYLGGRHARARVEIDINKPLTIGTQLQIKGKAPMFIQYQYERLQQFCFKCGQLGHIEQEYEETVDSLYLNQYNETLRVPSKPGKEMNMSGERTNTHRSTIG